MRDVLHDDEILTTYITSRVKKGQKKQKPLKGSSQLESNQRWSKIFLVVYEAAESVIPPIQAKIKVVVFF